MTINAWLSNAILKLESASVPTARLDAEVLLADILGKDRSWVLAHPDFTLQGPTLQKLNKQIDRRVEHEPLAYIRGKQEFYGREFIVSPDTLTPRPETETMIEMLLEEVKSKKWEDGSGKPKELNPTPYPLLTIVDIGTGSGCIIITAALELSTTAYPLPPIHYIGLDISKPALKIAKQNSKKFKADVSFKKFDLTQESLPLNPTPYTLITANLPYVPEDFQINLAATHEPAFAIYGGKDGLDFYRKLFAQLKTSHFPAQTSGCTILTESMPPQHDALKEIALKNGYKLHKTQDFIQLFIQK